MADDHNSWNLQMFNSIFSNSHHILIQRIYLVGHIPMHEHLTNVCTKNFLWDYPRIRTSNPKKFRRLASHMLSIILGILRNCQISLSLILFNCTLEGLWKLCSWVICSSVQWDIISNGIVYRLLDGLIFGAFLFLIASFRRNLSHQQKGKSQGQNQTQSSHLFGIYLLTNLWKE